MEQFELEITIRKLIDDRKKEVDREHRRGQKYGEAAKWLGWKVAELEGEFRRIAVGEDYDGHGRKHHVVSNPECKDCMLRVVREVLAYAKNLRDEERAKKMFGGDR